MPAAVDFYVNRLGFKQGFTWSEPPTLAGVNLGDAHQVQIFLERGDPNPKGCSVSVVIGDRGSYNTGAGADDLDFPVRLEARLAALARDLAVHKGTSVDSCLEEILLHACERSATASPARVRSERSTTSRS